MRQMAITRDPTEGNPSDNCPARERLPTVGLQEELEAAGREKKAKWPVPARASPLSWVQNLPDEVGIVPRP